MIGKTNLKSIFLKNVVISKIPAQNRPTGTFVGDLLIGITQSFSSNFDIIFLITFFNHFFLETNRMMTLLKLYLLRNRFWFVAPFFAPRPQMGNIVRIYPKPP